MSDSSAAEAKLASDLRQAISEVRRHTRIGTTAIASELDSVGPIACIETQLNGGIGRFCEAAVRIGRANLTVEAIAVRHEGLGLISRDLLAVARSRLAQVPPEKFQADGDGIDEGIRTLDTRRFLNGQATAQIRLAQKFRDTPTSSELLEWLEAGAPARPTGEFREAADGAGLDDKVLAKLNLRFADWDRSCAKELRILVQLLAQVIEPSADEILAIGEVLNSPDFPCLESDENWEYARDEEIYPRIGDRAFLLAHHIGELAAQISLTYPDAPPIWQLGRGSNRSPELESELKSLSTTEWVLVIMAEAVYRQCDDLYGEVPIFLPAPIDDKSQHRIYVFDKIQSLGDWDEFFRHQSHVSHPWAVLANCFRAAIGTWVLIHGGIPEDPTGESGADRIRRLISFLDEQSGSAGRNTPMPREVQLLLNLERYTEELKQRCGPVWDRMDKELQLRLADALRTARDPLKPDSLDALRSVALDFETKLKLQFWKAFLWDLRVKVGERGVLFEDKRHYSFWKLGDICKVLESKAYRRDASAIADRSRIQEVIKAIEAVRPERNRLQHGRPSVTSQRQADEIVLDWLSNPEPGGIFRCLFPPD